MLAPLHFLIRANRKCDLAVWNAQVSLVVPDVALCICKAAGRFRIWKAKYLPCPKAVVLVRHMFFGKSMLAVISRPCLRLQSMCRMISPALSLFRKSAGGILVEFKTPSAQTVAEHFWTWEANRTLASHAYEHLPAIQLHLIESKIVVDKNI